MKIMFVAQESPFLTEVLINEPHSEEGDHSFVLSHENVCQCGILAARCPHSLTCLLLSPVLYSWKILPTSVQGNQEPLSVITNLLGQSSMRIQCFLGPWYCPSSRFPKLHLVMLGGRGQVMLGMTQGQSHAEQAS